MEPLWRGNILKEVNRSSAKVWILCPPPLSMLRFGMASSCTGLMYVVTIMSSYVQALCCALGTLSPHIQQLLWIFAFPPSSAMIPELWEERM